jgi:hypothetical protein
MHHRRQRHVLDVARDLSGSAPRGQVQCPARH